MRALPLLVTILALLAGNALAAAEKWVLYKNDTLLFQMKRPAGWSLAEKGRAVALFGPGDRQTRASFGILHSPQSGVTLEQLYQQRFETAGKPTTWVKSPAKFAGMPALKVVSPDDTPGRKRIMYFVERPAGLYVVHCSAPEASWAAISPLFATMITSFSFQEDPAESNEILKGLE